MNHDGPARPIIARLSADATGSVTSAASDAPAGSTKGLRPNVLGFVASVAIALAATAPTYSLAASLGTIVARVHEQATVVLLLAFVPTLFVAVACQQLNAAMPDCGTTFTWTQRAFGPWTGWMGGWGMMTAALMVMVNLAQVAGQCTFLLLGADTIASQTVWTTAAGCLWIIATGVQCFRGIELTARTQCGLLAVEAATLVFFAAAALARVLSDAGPAGAIMPSWHWLNPAAVASPGALANAVLLAVFVYWGWDSVLSMNEETRDRERTPGLAALLATVILLLLYTLVTIAAVAVTGAEEGSRLNDPDLGNVLNALGQTVFGHSVLSRVIVLSTLVSAIACLQTTILPTARALLSMASVGALPGVFTRIHPRFHTPSAGTMVFCGLSMVYFIAASSSGSDILTMTLNGIGLSIAFYYALTAFACVAYFRRSVLRSPRHFILRGLLPLVGGVILLLALIRSTSDLLWPDGSGDAAGTPLLRAVVGIGPLAAGVLIMMACRITAPRFFEATTRDSQ